MSLGGHHFRGLTIPDVNRKKNASIVLLYDTVSLSLICHIQAVLQFAQSLPKVKVYY